MPSLTVPGLPFALEPQGPASGHEPRLLSDGVELRASAHTDLFLSPAGFETAPDAERYLASVTGDFKLSAHVDVDFRSLFDAGVLLGWVDDDNWFKLCAEFDPTGRPRIVSVVTRDGVSDDCNSWAIAGGGAALRISRQGSAFALHAAREGEPWELVRHFSLGLGAHEPIAIGLLAQSPTGEGSTTRFTQLSFAAEAPADIRDGS